MTDYHLKDFVFSNRDSRNPLEGIINLFNISLYWNSFILWYNKNIGCKIGDCMQKQKVWRS